MPKTLKSNLTTYDFHKIVQLVSDVVGHEVRTESALTRDYMDSRFAGSAVSMQSYINEYVGGAVDSIMTGINDLDKRLGNLETRFTGLESRFSKLENLFDSFRSQFGNGKLGFSFGKNNIY
jgi:hypothetical protein